MTVLAIALLLAGGALIYYRWPEPDAEADRDAQRPAPATVPSGGGGGSSAGPAVSLRQNLPTPKHPVEIAGLRMLSLRPNTVAAFRAAPVPRDEPLAAAVRFVSVGTISMVVTAGKAPAGLALDESFLRQAVELDLRGTPLAGQAPALNTLGVSLASGQPAAAGYAFLDAGGQKVLLQYRVFREGEVAWRVAVLAPPPRNEDVDALLETLVVVNPADYGKAPATRPAATHPTTQP